MQSQQPALQPVPVPAPAQLRAHHAGAAGAAFDHDDNDEPGNIEDDDGDDNDDDGYGLSIGDDDDDDDDYDYDYSFCVGEEGGHNGEEDGGPNSTQSCPGESEARLSSSAAAPTGASASVSACKEASAETAAGTTTIGDWWLFKRYMDDKAGPCAKRKFDGGGAQHSSDGGSAKRQRLQWARRVGANNKRSYQVDADLAQRHGEAHIFRAGVPFLRHLLVDFADGVCHRSTYFDPYYITARMCGPLVCRLFYQLIKTTVRGRARVPTAALKLNYMRMCMLERSVPLLRNCRAWFDLSDWPAMTPTQKKGQWMAHRMFVFGDDYSLAPVWPLRTAELERVFAKLMAEAEAEAEAEAKAAAAKRDAPHGALAERQRLRKNHWLRKTHRPRTKPLRGRA